MSLEDDPNAVRHYQFHFKRRNQRVKDSSECITYLCWMADTFMKDSDAYDKWLSEKCQELKKMMGGSWELHEFVVDDKLKYNKNDPEFLKNFIQTQQVTENKEQLV